MYQKVVRILLAAVILAILLGPPMAKPVLADCSTASSTVCGG